MVLTVLLALVFGAVEPQTLQTFDANRVEQVRIANNRRIPKDTILYQLQTKAGDRLNPEIIRADVKRLYAQGHFDDIRVEEEDGKTGKIITFFVVHYKFRSIGKVEGQKGIHLAGIDLRSQQDQESRNDYQDDAR
jgi:outer membrane protein assembly factor BamA